MVFIIIENLNWEEKREKREKDALDRHAQLLKLFVEDRLGFERERKRIIDEFLNYHHDNCFYLWGYIYPNVV